MLRGGRKGTNDEPNGRAITDHAMTYHDMYSLFFFFSPGEVLEHNAVRTAVYRLTLAFTECHSVVSRNDMYNRTQF